jgi:hypothetical protein
VANAYFQVGEARVEVLASRAEQVAQTLRLYNWRGGRELADRIAAHIADEAGGADILRLDDELDQRELLDALQRLELTSQSVPDDLAELAAALRASISAPRRG